MIGDDGALSTRTGNSTTFTAGSFAGTATVVALGFQGSCLASSIIFTIITPTVANYNTLQLYHSQNYADIGFGTNIFEMPNTVSFYNTYVEEAQAYYTATGVYFCKNGTPHENGPVPLPASITVGVYGTANLGVDTSYSGYCPGNQLQDGSLTINIPTQYSVGGSGGPWYGVNSIAGATSATAAGALSKSKDHAFWNTTVGSPTIGF